MIKRTLYFGNPAYLSMRNNQLVVKLPEIEKNDTLPENFKKNSELLTYALSSTARHHRPRP